MINDEIFQKVRSVPAKYVKTIEGGSLRGLSNINPMWRIERLTQLFGACGEGWVIDVEDVRNDVYNTGVMVTILLSLRYKKEDGEYSEKIYGYGSCFMPKPDDSAFKKAFTDAFGSCTKMLGFAADIFYEGKERERGFKKEVTENGEKTV